MFRPLSKRRAKLELWQRLTQYLLRWFQVCKLNQVPKVSCAALLNKFNTAEFLVIFILHYKKILSSLSDSFKSSLNGMADLGWLRLSHLGSSVISSSYVILNHTLLEYSGNRIILSSKKRQEPPGILLGKEHWAKSSAIIKSALTRIYSMSLISPCLSLSNYQNLHQLSEEECRQGFSYLY